MTLEQQRDRAAAFGGELQPTGGSHGRAPRLADHCAKAAVAQSLLHQCEHLGIVIGLGIEQAVRGQPDLSETGREQIAAPHHPQNRTPGTRGDARKEQSGAGVVARCGAGSGDFVERVEPQTAIGEPGIERADPERQRLAPPVADAFDGAERFAEGGNEGGRHMRLGEASSKGEYVPILFLLPSQVKRRGTPNSD